MGAMKGRSDDPVVDLATAADRLYGLDPGDFTTERKAMAAAVRSRGDRELARRIEGLRAPTVAAWTVNQLIRARPDQADTLRRTGEMLRAAQARLDAGELRSLRPQRDALLAAFLAAAATVAAVRGQALSPAVQAEVRNTLVAALADERGQETVLSGQLVKALLYAGLGEVPLPAGQTPGPPPGAGVGAMAGAGTGSGTQVDKEAASGTAGFRQSAQSAEGGVPCTPDDDAPAHPVGPQRRTTQRRAAQSRSARREAERRREQSEANRRRERAAKDRVRTADQALAAASLAEAQARQQVEAGRQRIAEFESLLESARGDQAALEADARVAAEERAAAAAALESARAELAALAAAQS